MRATTRTSHTSTRARVIAPADEVPRQPQRERLRRRRSAPAGERVDRVLLRVGAQDGGVVPATGARRPGSPTSATETRRSRSECDVAVAVHARQDGSRPCRTGSTEPVHAGIMPRSGDRSHRLERISYHGNGFPKLPETTGLMSHNGRHRGDQEQRMASQVEVDPQETREWLEALDAVVASDGPQRAQFLLERVVGHAQLTGAAPGARGHDAVPEHDPAAGRAASSRRRGARAASTVDRALERDRDDPQREQDVLGARRPHRQLPVGGGPLRDRLQPLLERAERASHGGDLVFMQGHSSPGRLRARVPRGPHHRGADAQLPHGGRRRRALAPTRTRG